MTKAQRRTYSFGNSTSPIYIFQGFESYIIQVIARNVRKTEKDCSSGFPPHSFAARHRLSLNFDQAIKEYADVVAPPTSQSFWKSPTDISGITYHVSTRNPVMPQQ
jgi:hypothetical protein